MQRRFRPHVLILGVIVWTLAAFGVRCLLRHR
jgi:hypothetical protein